MSCLGGLQEPDRTLAEALNAKPILAAEGNLGVPLCIQLLHKQDRGPLEGQQELVAGPPVAPVVLGTESCWCLRK